MCEGFSPGRPSGFTLSFAQAAGDKEYIGWFRFSQFSYNQKQITNYVSSVLSQHKNLDFHVGSLVSQKGEQKC